LLVVFYESLHSLFGSVSHNIVWSQCTGELGVLLRALASVRASLRSFLNLSICCIESELGVVELENRKLCMLGVSSVSESSSVWKFSALEIGQTLLALGVVGSSGGSGELWGCPPVGSFFGSGVYPFHP